MNTYSKYLIAIILITLSAFWAVNHFTKVEDSEVQQTKTALEIAGNECESIAEKSVAHMTAVVEFQQLEIFGRKMRVMRLCMNDHGFFENEKWSEFAIPVAQASAKKDNISFDEALENLKRKKMLVFLANNSEPLFWAKAQTTPVKNIK